VSPWPALLIAGLAILLAAIGFIDDRRSIPPRVRLAAQIILAAGMVATLPLDMATLLVPPVIVGAVLVVAAVYWINIFNFMDGIDGLAASQALVMLLGAAFLALASGTPLNAPMIWWMFAIAAASLGLLVLNWPPASIFMGDAGSTYLGFMLVYLAYATIAAGWLNLAQWLILSALFVTDATITLLRRATRGEPVFEAHRLHAYQHLSRRWQSHRAVTLLAIAVNVVWLLPLAWAAGTWHGFEPVATALAYGPLIILVALAGAGAPEAEEVARTSS
jgi:Fuc2NAc and GlcNAc transferase